MDKGASENCIVSRQVRFQYDKPHTMYSSPDLFQINNRYVSLVAICNV